MQKNQNSFKTTEKVALSYVLLDPAVDAVKSTVTEEEIQTFYQKNIDRWQGKDGIQPLAEVKDKVKADAIKQKTAKQLYELAADTLFKNIKSTDLNLIAGALKLKVQETELFSAAAPAAVLAGEAAVIKKALELKQGELGGPVETTKGIYILLAKERKVAIVPPLAEIKSAVEVKARETKAVELAKKKADDAAKLFSTNGVIKGQSTGVFGFSAKGDIPVIGTSPEIVEAVFKLSKAQAPATPFKVGNRWFAVRLKERVEAPKSQFDVAREELKKKMLPKKQDDALMEWSKALREKAKIEINQTLIADK